MCDCVLLRPATLTRPPEPGLEEQAKNRLSFVGLYNVFLVDESLSSALVMKTSTKHTEHFSYEAEG